MEHLISLLDVVSRPVAQGRDKHAKYPEAEGNTAS